MTVSDAAAPPGIDLPAVGRLLGQAGLRAEVLSRGRSNLTYRLRNDAGEWVLRRPPLGHVLETAHDMAREYRVLTALRDTEVPVPRTIMLCEDTEVIGAPFYLMDMVHGVVVGGQPPAGYADTSDERRRMAESFIATLVAIHAVDWMAVGLEGFGRPDGYLQRQVRRWARQWEGNRTRPLPAIDELHSRIEDAVPQQSDSTIVHGDYSLNNVMLAPDNPGRIVAVLDWEMSTLGDPLADLGWVMAFWPEADGDDAVAALGVERPAGLPPRRDMVDLYARLSGRPLEHLGFHVALANYKMAVILEGIHARFLKGQTVGEGFDGFGARVPVLAEAGLAALPAS